MQRRRRGLLQMLGITLLACSKQPPAEDRVAPDVRNADAPVLLKVASWNLEWLRESSDAGVVPRQDADYARLKKYAERLDADVIAVQEIDGEGALRRVFDDTIYDYHVASQSGVQLTGFAYRSTLSIEKNADYAPLDVGGVRTGADLTVSVNGTPLRLLSVHLKSGCFDQPLSTPSNACTKLADQLPALEQWVDERAARNEPFVILGDFNRRMKTGEAFYTELDDAEPPGADLTLTTDGRRSECWGGQYPQFIDHIVLSRDAAAWLVAGSFAQLEYDASDASFKERLSDHCPLSVVLSPGGAGVHAVPVSSDAALAEPDGSAREALPIKANINSDGKKLYHLPTCPSYADTVIDESKGERLFATETDAIAAGWQKAGNCP